jgi:starch-binding outer membrane protein, SusD/RagB family
MKNMKKFLIISLITSFMIGCQDNLEYFPIDQLTTEAITGNPELLQTATYGNYSYMRRGRTGADVQNIRHRLREFMSDDLIMMRWSSNHMTYTLTYLQVVDNNNARDFWNAAYYAIFACNTVIEAIPDNSSAQLLHLKGENLWMRAQWTFDLVNMFSRPYSHDDPETNLGVMLRDNTDVFEMTPRSTVKDTYDFIEKDLLKSAELMTLNKANKYASKEVAYATLARLYLYKEDNARAIEYADKVLNSGRYQLVNTETLPEFARLGPERNNEIIFAIKLRPEENQGRTSVGTLYHRDGGWNEIMASSSLLDLLWKNENDQRKKFIDPHFILDAQGNKIPDPDEPYFGYAMYDRMGLLSYNTLKHTYEYDQAMLHSTTYYRLAEMYLIKAEAHAKRGEDQLALDNVNIIRERAGLSGNQLFSTDDLKGYDTVLDVVLDEKRMEFFLEEHRAYDVFRNKRTMDRSYKAWQGWSGPSYIPYWSNRIIHFIHTDELTRNPNLVQNPPLEPISDLPTSLP